MSDARIERIEPDPWAAATFLAQSRKFFADGGNDGNSLEGRQLLLHNAAMAACDAVLAINGREVRGSDGGHSLRLTETEPLLGTGLEDLFERLDDARVSRNDASYRAAAIPVADVEQTIVAVGELIDLVADHLDPQLPTHLRP